MQIVISGTHASGKSTLISDFAMRHREFIVLPDAFELLDEAWDRPGAGMFAAQLGISAARLVPDDASECASDRIAERGPIDFLAYLLALEEITRISLDDDLLERARAVTAEALSHVDLLVALPLMREDALAPGPEEHPELRAAMNDALLDLLGDAELLGAATRVVEVAGDPAHRCSSLESLVSEWRASNP